jgi:hypothetical protein
VVFVVQEFRTAQADAARQAANARDLDAFAERLTCGLAKAIPSGQVVGPLNVPGHPLLSQPPRLYLLKVVCEARG